MRQVCADNRRGVWAFLITASLAGGCFAWLAVRSRHRPAPRRLALDGQGVQLIDVPGLGRTRARRRIAWSRVAEVDVERSGWGPFRRQDLVFHLIDSERVEVPADGSPHDHALDARGWARTMLRRWDPEAPGTPPDALEALRHRS